MFSPCRQSLLSALPAAPGPPSQLSWPLLSVKDSPSTLSPLFSSGICNLTYQNCIYMLEKRSWCFFVDNGPWVAERSQRSKSVEFWQLMVTQSRISPFANRSLRCASTDRGNAEELDDSTANVPRGEKWSLKRRLFHKEQSRLVKLFRDLFQIRLRSVVSVQELSQLLHGCVTFELEWINIRGINYLNELQTDTCVALEIKRLVKRDFCNIKEASAFYGIEYPQVFLTIADVTTRRHLEQKSSLESNNPGAIPESYSGTLSFNEFLSDNRRQRVDHNHRDDQCSLSDSDCEFFDSVCQLGRAVSSETDRRSPVTVTSTGESAKQGLDTDFRNQFFDTIQCSCELEEKAMKELIVGSHETCSCPQSPNEEGESESPLPGSPHSSNFSDNTRLQDDDEDEALLVYRDTLLMFRFCDPLLPLELGQIITADQRLLKMLESGLPTWVIFLQSYPVVRKLYRPWMRPLAKTMYILVSVITVIIGFYDLYKNVPVLKATAARICGPFFEWIEAWEMVSRVKYLGTVIFLQNWEKAFRWLLLVFGTMRKLSNLVLQPLVEPLEEVLESVWPAWNVVLDSVWGIISLMCMMCSSVLEYTNFVFQILVLPFIWLLSAIGSLVTWVLYPIIYTFWGFIVLPIRLTRFLVDCIIAVMCEFYQAIQSFWSLVNNSFQLLSVTGPQAERTANSSASTLRLLWNDIFSQVFRAVRSIVNVFVAFFTTCNRHRLSIYNHMEAFIFQLRGLIKAAPWRVSNACHQALDAPLPSQDDFADEGHKRSSRSSVRGQTPRQRSRKKVHLADK